MIAQVKRQRYPARGWLLLVPLLVAVVWLLRVAFATISPPPSGPILVVTSSQSTYGAYYAEILRAEGLNQFDVADISNLNAALPGHDVVVLANMTLTPDQVSTLTSWVTGGGNLIAMAPDAQLAGLLGLTNAATTLSNGYLLVDTTTAAGNGIVSQTVQFHGTAKGFALNGASSIAKLYSTATSATTNPAVTLRSVGAGQAAAFAYDLATSVVYTRQGNPAWAAQERDGFTPIRSDDKFFGAATGDVQPDWVDLNKVAIPQADEQQRLFANLILTMNAAKKPLPRFWYFPNGKKAVVIMSGDDHANGGTAGRFDQFIASSPADCNVPNWECVRGTSYVYPGTPLTNAQAASYVSQGFEVGVHITTNCTDFTASSLETTYQQELADWSAQYTSLPSPITMRHHCIVWSDWVTAAKTELAHGIRLDVSYYFWPPGWVNNVPGLFTGSAMPMRLADLDGSLIDVYEATTQMTDESGQTYPFTIDTLLDRALGPEGYYGVYTVNAHTDTATSDVSDAVVASAQARNVPIVSSAQMLTWLDARNNSSFASIGWNNGTLSFGINPAPNANGLQAMLPRQSSAGPISSLTRNGAAVTLTYTTVKGIQYVMFSAASGSYVATYAPDTTPPSVTTTSPAANATGVSVFTTVKATFSEPIDPSTIQAGTFVLLDASNASVPASVSYDASSLTATLTPTNALTGTSTYKATIKGGAAGVKDTSGNPMASDFSWSFTTGSGPNCPCVAFSPSAVPQAASTADNSSVEVGVKFRSDVPGTITGIRFYKGTGNTGTHVGHLWTLGGQLLATATFANETASGWQQVNFATPVTIAANTVYVASYFAPAGNYASDSFYFANAGVDNPPLHLLKDGLSGGDGVYAYGTGATFPTNTFQSTNYWVDIVFTTNGADTTPPTVTAKSPADGSTVSTSTTVTATFSEAIDPSSLTASTFFLTGTGGNVATTLSYNAATSTATLAPNAALAASATYTATIVGGSGGVKDLAGNALASNVTWGFTTSVTACPCTIWPASAGPGTSSQNDGAAVNVGVKFTSDVSGYITGIRFYKGSGNTGTHIGTLWSSAGQQLATATFTGESTSGWQQVNFASPVAILANTVYVASYFAPVGHYAGDTGFFATVSVDNAPLHALKDGGVGGANGVYAYASSNAFPTSTFQSTNYWVDVVFSTTASDTTPPTVASTSPASNATGVSTTTTVAATFSEAIDPTTINGQTFQLFPGTSPSGTAVSATVTYNSANATATLTPGAALTLGATYTATITGGSGGVKDLAGNALASNFSWSFTTGVGACAAPANPIVAENCLTGNPSSEWDVSGAGDTSIQGFATDISVNRGSAVSFKIDTNATSYRLDIYRMGYYGGMGARKVATVNPSASLPQNQPACRTDSTTGLIDCGNWGVSASWSVPSDAVSGIYFARALRSDTGGASHIFFIVRNDASTSPLFFQTSDTTWQAYNNYGGNSLYTGGPGTNPSRAYKVSYNRPFNTRAVDGGQDWVFNAEYPMVRWLEANGYDVSYTTGVDTDRNGSLITQHKVFMSVGHDEYWSAGQRGNVEAARTAGVNLAFFSGNEIFWKTRWEASNDGTNTPYRTLVSYKETHANARIDPLDVSPTWTWTGTWRDPRFSPPSDGGRPENAVTGTIFMVNDGATTSITVPAADGKMRFWRNTSIATATGTTTLPNGTLGYEWDADLDNGFRPAGAFRLSTTTSTNNQVLQDYGSTFGSGTVTHALTLYRHASGALVFGAGTVQWSWGLDANHDRSGTAVDGRMRQATVNLFADMGVQPATLQSGLVAATASTDGTPPASVITSPVAGSTVTPGTTVTITGTANDTGGGVVGGVEVSVDGGATWHPATGRANWTYAWTTPPSGTVTIKSRAVDDSGNLETPGPGITVTSGSATGAQTLVGDSNLETIADSNTSGVAEAFLYTAIASGTGTTLHLYLDGTNAATKVVTGLYSNSTSNTPATLLAQATISAPTNGAWNTVALPSTSITSGTRYWIAILGPSGGGQVKFRDTTGTGLSQTTSQSTLTTLPATWSSGTTYTTGPMSAYVTQDTDTTPPTVTNISPASGATGVPTTTAVSATFSEAMNASTITGTTFFLTPNGSTTPVTAAVSYDTATFVATLTPNAALAANTTYNVTVRSGANGVKDVAGNALAADRTWSFTTAAPDATPPTITKTSPTSGATGIATNATVTATFSEAMAASTISGQTFLLTPNGSTTPVTATVSYNTTTFVATLTPSAPLAINTIYQATIKGSVTDAAGNALGTDITWSFTTAGDTTPPTVTSTTPANGATGVATSSVVTATFSEAIDPATVNSTTFKLAAGTSAVAATVTYDSTTFVAMLTPSAPLSSGTTYTATISGVKDAAGNALASNFTWSFTTTANLLVGNATVQSTVDSDKAGTAEAFLYTATVSGTAAALHLYVDASSTAKNVAVGLYSHNAATNAPATLLGQVTIATPTGGWNAVTLPSTVPITSGTNYWIAVLGPSGSGTIKFRDKNGGGRSQVSSQTTLTTLPPTWSSGKSFNTGAMSAYASP